jgi:hypothetical protein
MVRRLYFRIAAKRVLKTSKLWSRIYDERLEMLGEYILLLRQKPMYDSAVFVLEASETRNTRKKQLTVNPAIN